MHTCLSSRAKEEIGGKKKKKKESPALRHRYYILLLEVDEEATVWRNWDCVSCVSLTIDIAGREEIVLTDQQLRTRLNIIDTESA